MSMSIETQDILTGIIQKITPLLDEKQRRLIFGVIASEIGYGGVAFVSNVSGAARNTIYVGEEESELITNDDDCTDIELDEFRGCL